MRYLILRRARLAKKIWGSFFIPWSALILNSLKAMITLKKLGKNVTESCSGYLRTWCNTLFKNIELRIKEILVLSSSEKDTSAQVGVSLSFFTFYFDNPSLNSAQVYLQFLPICNLIEKNGNKRKRGRRRSVNKLINALRLSLNYNIGIIQSAILHSIAIVERL